MPLKMYTLVHGNAKLNETEINSLNWIKITEQNIHINNTLE